MDYDLYWVALSKQFLSADANNPTLYTPIFSFIFLGVNISEHF